MKVKILGSGSANPAVGRKPTSVLISNDHESILIDCGEGTQFTLLENKISFNKINIILISHLHGDHYLGLIGLLFTMNLNGRTKPLILIGPSGLKEIIIVHLQQSQAVLDFEVIFKATQNKHLEIIYQDSFWQIDSFPLQHRVPTTGFLVTQKAGSPNIIKNKLPDNFPVEGIKTLISREDYFDNNTQKLYPYKEYTEEKKKGKTFAYCSDTSFLPEISNYIKDADLLFHEATFEQDLSERAKKTGHSTAIQAAEIAKKAQVNHLVIGHFSSRYKSLEKLHEEAKSVFENTSLAQENDDYFL